MTDAADTALVLAAHGERGGARDNASLLSHRDALAARGIFQAVSAGTLRSDPDFDEALATGASSGAGRILVYPFFMSDGYFVRRVLAERITDAGVKVPVDVLGPLGCDPDLCALLLERAGASAAQAQFAPEATRLLVVGHGSKFGRESAEATEAMAEMVRGAGPFAYVETAFLEEPPMVTDALAGDQRQTVVAGFFSGDGMHAHDDVPAAIKETGANAVYTGAIGAHPRVPDLIMSAALASLAGAAS